MEAVRRCGVLVSVLAATSLPLVGLTTRLYDPALTVPSTLAPPPTLVLSLAWTSASENRCNSSDVGISFVQLNAKVMSVNTKGRRARALTQFACLTFCFAVMSLITCCIWNLHDDMDHTKSRTDSHSNSHVLDHDTLNAFAKACGLDDDSNSSGPSTSPTSRASRDIRIPPVRVTTEKVLREASESFQQDGSKSSSFVLIITFPLPSATSKAEEDDWSKRFLQTDDPRQERLQHLVHAFMPRTRSSNTAHIVNCGDTLAEMRNYVIELLHSLLVSSGSSLGPVDVFCFTSADAKELFMCVKASDAFVQRLAEMTAYPVQLSLQGLAQLNIRLPPNDRSSAVLAYTGYSVEQDEQGCFRTFLDPLNGKLCVFRQLDRLVLLRNLISANLHINELMRLGCLKQVFPLHDVEVCHALHASWGTFSLVWSLQQPIHEVRNYFGESIAFYFLFLEKLCKAMILLFMIALPVWCVKMWPDRVSPRVQKWAPVCFCVSVVIWYICFRKSWLRVETQYSNIWGTDGVEADDAHSVNRFFHGKPKPSPLDLNVKTLQADPMKRAVGVTCSVLVTMVYVGLISVCIVLTISYTNALPLSGNHFAFSLLGIFLSVQIQVFNFLWNFIATFLTDLELIVLQCQYDESHNLKLFIVYYFNFFASFFYIAFIQEKVAPQTCEIVGGCLHSLETNSVTVFLSNIAFGFLDMVFPVVTYKFALWLEARSVKSEQKAFDVSFLEKQTKMPEYTDKESFDDYFQLISALSFLIYFGVHSPMTMVVMAYVAIRVQLRADAWKLVHAYQRTTPEPSNGIGIWSRLLGLNEYVCIVVNSGHIANFFSDAFLDIPVWRHKLESLHNDDRFMPRALLFFVFCVIFLIFRALLDTFVSDTPSRAKLEKDRQKHQTKHLSATFASHHGVQVKLHGSADTKNSALDAIPMLRRGSPFFTDGLI
eukprot:TRINITY_DN10063_c0_g1_i2.p1 TRINITY_DN10063_c0_g1~~TRINITY_DN10063_c0_g1_i2.p1  ORF type:complete len:937 (-),score=110.17 TRINITY_DN10063_c0_g1_i2:71-2881(-)